MSRDASPNDEPTAEASDTEPAATGQTFGGRLRAFRGEAGLSLTELAAKSDVSKGYLSSLENDVQTRRPSADVMYKLAKALGVTMSDLMGRKLLAAAATDIPDSLSGFAREAGLAEADIRMLASIRFRGEPPKTSERWRYIYDSIRASAVMDE